MTSRNHTTLALVDQVHGEFTARVDVISGSDWAGPTPCDEWDVSQLVEHVASAAVIYGALIRGSAFEDAMAAPPPSVAIEGLRAHCANASAELRHELGEPGGLTAACDVPGGPITGADLATVRVFDVTVHCWDLARALGLPEALPERLVARAWRYAVSHYGDRAAAAALGVHNGPAGLSQNAAQLLRITGRNP